MQKKRKRICVFAVYYDTIWYFNIDETDNFMFKLDN